MYKHWIASSCIVLCITAFGQPRLPKNYYWQKLDNGLEVVVIENHKVPLATIEIAVKNGAYTEGPEYSGLSHLFEHMFFKANKDYPDQQKFITRTEELGMIWNGTTGDEVRLKRTRSDTPLYEIFAAGSFHIVSISSRMSSVISIFAALP